MNKIIPILLLLAVFSRQASAQHYQRIINSITACKTLSCVEALKQEYKALKPFSPQVRALGPTAQRYLYDFALEHKGNSGPTALKNFRLSLLLEGDMIQYGQLEQLNAQGTPETTYLFKNNFSFLNGYVEAYNKNHNTRFTYQDLTSSITSRVPSFWVWID